MECGADDYITKPFDHMVGIVQRVDRAVEKRQQQRALEQAVTRAIDLDEELDEARRQRQAHAEVTGQLRAANAQLEQSRATVEAAFVQSAPIIARIATLQGSERKQEIERFRAFTASRVRAVNLRPHTGQCRVPSLLYRSLRKW